MIKKLLTVERYSVPESEIADHLKDQREAGFKLNSMVPTGELAPDHSALYMAEWLREERTAVKQPQPSVIGRMN